MNQLDSMKATKSGKNSTEVVVAGAASEEFAGWLHH